MKLLQRLLAKKQTVKTDRWSVYRQVLARRDTPNDDDADLLDGLLTDLSLEPHDVALHAAAMEEYERLDGEFVEYDKANEVVSTAESELQKLHAERAAFLQEINARIAKVREPLDEAKHSVIAAGDRRIRLDILARDLPQIFPQARPVCEQSQLNGLSGMTLATVSPKLAAAVQLHKRGLAEPPPPPPPRGQTSNEMAVEGTRRVRRAYNERIAREAEAEAGRTTGPREHNRANPVG